MKRPTATVISMKDEKPPPYGTVPFIYQYANGNMGSGLGQYDKGQDEWDIEYSDDHPDSDDIKYWIDIKLEG